MRNMDKKTLKIRIERAIKDNPHKNEIKKISLFGSRLRGEEKKTSDIDLLIEFSPSARVGFLKFIDIQEQITRSLGKEVDLLTPEALNKYFREKVLDEAEVVYEG